MPDDRKPSAEERLDALEASHLQQLAELRALRADLRRGTATPLAPAMHAAPAPAPRPSAPRPHPSTRGPDINVEQLVGRYGTIAVATLAILLGVGAFLQWAIARGLLGPEIRVLLGAVVAAALVAAGLRLRARGADRFGNVLLAIALAVVHLDAWAAGPGLSLVPHWVSLVVAALASAALAALAVAEEEQVLFVLGVAGALVAPFVADWDGVGNGSLLAYGWIVASAATVALWQGDWVFARRVVTTATGMYVVAGLFNVPWNAEPDVRRWPALFALGIAVSSTLFAHSVHRRPLGRNALAYMALALLVVTERTGGVWQDVSMAFVGLLAIHAMRWRAAPGAPRRDAVMGTLVLPVAFHVAALMALDGETVIWQTSVVAAAWALVGLGIASSVAREERAPHLAAALTSVLIGVSIAALEHQVTLAVLSSALVFATLKAMDDLEGRSLVIPLLFGLTVTTAAAAVLVDDRIAYEYTPFLTHASLAMLAATAAWVGTSRIVSAEFGGPAVGVAAILLWGHVELVDAFSGDIATFLLITYYAVFGVALIGIGRSRGAAAFRNAGLVLALFAAAKAVVQASDFSNVGFRVASYLIVGVFLLGVGWWYRAGSDEAAVPRRGAEAKTGS
jgi:uncharacterized membrane protein